MSNNDECERAFETWWKANGVTADYSGVERNPFFAAWKLQRAKIDIGIGFYQVAADRFEKTEKAYLRCNKGQL